ncbi:MAG: hypothetical protein K2P94_17860 [Rhodospirillaceae bacterium]|nr:hypothetical protein [Rhodospirillaceae bacterium]
MYRISRAQWTMALRRFSLALAFATLATVPLLRSATAASDDRYKVASGVAVYLGLLPAELIKGHPKSHPESTMHNGKPGGVHEYHLVAAVFDEKASARIEDASVKARVSGLGLAGESIALEPMSIANTVTYGGFINLPDDLYTIRITVRRPGVSEPVTLDFKFDHRLVSRR